MAFTSEFLDGLGKIKFLAAIVNLAAMDAIVDAASGSVEEELINEVTQAASAATQLFEGKRHKDAALDLNQDTKPLENDFAALVAAANEIFDAVNSGKPNQKLLASLDDKIDGTRSSLVVTADQNVASLQAALQKERESVATTTRQANIMTLSILITMFLVTFFLVGVQANLGGRRIQQEVMGLKKARQSLSRDADMLEKEYHRLLKAVTDQNASVAETVAAMTQIQSIIRRNNENISRVNGHLSESSQFSESGLQNAGEMTRALAGLSETSTDLQKIAEIVEQIAKKTEVINGIVFKTQILSFNASIEATRAGEHGKGFSVVAQEVGRLAELSGVSSSEMNQLIDISKNQIAKIIDGISKRLNATVTVSATMKDNFEELARRVHSIANSISDIDTGAKEQENGVGQCTLAMQEISGSNRVVSEGATRIGEQCSSIRSAGGTIALVSDKLVTLVAGDQSRSEPQRNVKSNPQDTPTPHENAGAEEEESDRDARDGSAETSSPFDSDDGEDDKAHAMLTRIRAGADREAS